MTGNTKDEHIGEQIGIYKILYLCDYKSNDGHKMYHIQCVECGWEKDEQYRRIKNLNSVCNHTTPNGLYLCNKTRWKNKRIQHIFNGMHTRCYNKNDKDYSVYGGKGVCICNEWLTNPSLFEEWSLSHGYKDNLTIDRIDSDKDYCPENCQWITFEENARKAGIVNWITVNDVTLTGRQWSDRLSLGPNTINTAIREYGLVKTKELIEAMLKDPPSGKHRKSHQTWFSTYGIQV